MKKFLAVLVLLLAPFAAQAERAGIWVATINNLDWPSKPGLSAEKQKAEMTAMLDKLKAMGFDTIVFQVRPMADAFWPSKLEPWSVFLTGEQGKNPGYDPLAFVVEETHKRGMELHAWFNPFRLSTSKKYPPYKDHPANKNKNWVIEYDNKLFLDPGNPAARAHIINVINEVVQNYNIDAVHVDDYFYPYPIAEKGKKVPFKDEKTFKKYAKKGQKLDDWRKENINIFFTDLKAAIKKIKPQITLGISPFGIWCNARDCHGGSDTTGFNSVLELYSDSKLWLNTGMADYIVPQNYWHLGHKKAPFGKIADWWANEAAGEQSADLYLGIAAYKQSEGEWQDIDELKKQIAYAREKKNIKGFFYFRAKHVLSDEKNVRQTITALNAPAK